MEQVMPPKIDQARNVPGRTVLMVRLMEDGTYIIAIPTQIQEAIQDMSADKNRHAFDHFRDDMLTSIRNLLEDVYSGKIQAQVAKGANEA